MNEAARSLIKEKSNGMSANTLKTIKIQELMQESGVAFGTR